MTGRAGRRATITLIVLAQSTQALAFGSIALFLPLIREDIDLDFTQAGLLAVVNTATYALMQIPAGYLADRVGPHRLFVVGLIGTNASYLVFAALDTFAPLLAIQAISGIFRSLVFAPGLILISTHFAPDRRSTAMGLYVAGGFSSNVVLSLVGPFLVGPLGWRMLFVLSASVAFVTVAAYARLGSVVREAPTATPVRLTDLAAILREPIVWAAGAIQYVRLAMVTAITFWLPTYLVVERGYDLRVAGAIVALGAALTAPSNFLGGYVSDRLGDPLLVIRVSLVVLAVCAVALVSVPSLPLVVLVVAVQAVFLQGYFGPLFAVPIAVLGPRTAGSVSGFSNLFANLGGLTFAYTLGAIRDASGSFDRGFHALAALSVLGLLATVVLGRLMERPQVR
jgi:ACS family D-galactonate transporter-like MFS transporter